MSTFRAGSTAIERARELLSFTSGHFETEILGFSSQLMCPLLMQFHTARLRIFALHGVLWVYGLNLGYNRRGWDILGSLAAKADCITIQRCGIVLDVYSLSIHFALLERGDAATWHASSPRPFLKPSV